ncbi:hypothetical protein ACFWB0_02900 [Rhodococcus sp. NPDC060086]
MTEPTVEITAIEYAQLVHDAALWRKWRERRNEQEARRKARKAAQQVAE